MAEPKFYIQRLKTPEGNEPSSYPILLLFSFNGQRLQYYTGERVPNLRSWIPVAKDGKLKKISGRYPFVNNVPGAERIMDNLDIIYNHAINIYSDFKRSGQVKSLTIKTFKNLLDERLKAKPEEIDQSKLTIEHYLSEYLAEIKKKNTYNTFRNNQSNINHLRSFLGKSGLKRSLDFIDESFSEEYSDYLKEGRLNNTVVKGMQILKQFLAYCKQKKYISSVPDIKTGMSNDINVIYLDYDEAMKLAYCPMPSISLEQVKDVFLFGVFTGMRFGDIAKLEKRHLFNDHIEYYIQKNGATVVKTVPYTPVSLSIVEKYKDLPGKYALPTISNQKTNDYLKIVGKYAGIDSTVNIAEKTGSGKIIEKAFKKYEILTCHVSRKSFISIALRLGMKESVVKSITGHSKSSKAFYRYYEIANEEKRESMQKIFGKTKNEILSDLLQKASQGPLDKSEIAQLKSLMN